MASEEHEGEFQIGRSSYVLNGKPVEMDVAPYIDNNGRTMVPVRFLGNALGIPDCDIDWDDDARKVTLTKDGKTIWLIVYSEALYVDGETVGLMDTSPVLINERVFLPVRYVAESFGHGVGWDAEDQRVLIKRKGTSVAPSLKPVTQSDPEEQSSDQGTQSPAPRTTLVHSFEYNMGFLVGVRGNRWYIPVSAGRPIGITITDHTTGERRTYKPSEAWRDDATVVALGLQQPIESALRTVADQQQQQMDQMTRQIMEQRRQDDLHRQLERQREMDFQRQLDFQRELDRQQQIQRDLERQQQIQTPTYSPPTTPIYTPPTTHHQPWSNFP